MQGARSSRKLVFKIPESSIFVLELRLGQGSRWTPGTFECTANACSMQLELEPAPCAMRRPHSLCAHCLQVQGHAKAPSSRLQSRSLRALSSCFALRRPQTSHFMQSHYKRFFLSARCNLLQATFLFVKWELTASTRTLSLVGRLICSQSILTDTYS